MIFFFFLFVSFKAPVLLRRTEIPPGTRDKSSEIPDGADGSIPGSRGRPQDRAGMEDEITGGLRPRQESGIRDEGAD